MYGTRAMKVVVFGASGGVGRCLVDQALTAGHWVTAAVRSPAAIASLTRGFASYAATCSMQAL
jgi:uncharacterized protein YbjT (DUF2867 family)